MNFRQYILSHCNVHSGVGRRKMLEALDHWMMEPQEINDEYDVTLQVDTSDKIKHILCGVQDIRGTLTRLQNGDVMDDIQLFEIKHLARSAKHIGFGNVDDILTILDPNNEDVDTFYIYDIYDERLTNLRKQYKADNDPEILASIMQVEDEVRQSLSKRLRLHANYLIELLESLGLLDYRIGKREMAISQNLTRPEITTDKWHYQALVNLEVQESIGEKYQPIDVDFTMIPTLVTGMNMGGKTVLLKSIGMAQEMLQHGFFVPATNAQMSLVNDVMYSIEDNQSAKDGLSSFAAEMLCIDEIIKTISAHSKTLVLIDELARTTNPAEGRIIVSRVVEILAKANVPAFVTTHYDGIEGCVRRIRVKGLRDHFDGDWRDAIDYSLVETNKDEVPHEAMRVAKALGISFLN